MKYHVVESPRKNGLAAFMYLIMSMIKRNWQPQGGICTGDHNFYQAMVKNE